MVRRLAARQRALAALVVRSRRVPPRVQVGLAVRLYRTYAPGVLYRVALA